MKNRGKILLVEDDFLQSFALKTMVQSMNYSVIGIAENGLQAVEMAALHKPDIILMDIVLNDEMSGIEAAIRIQDMFDVFIIYVTGLYDVDKLKDLNKTKFEDIVYKPVTREMLHDSLKNCVRP